MSTRRVFLVAFALAIPAACGAETTELVGSPTSTGGGGSAGADGAAGDAGTSACEPRACATKVYACGNCVDDDGDGLVDALDPECLGACDNTEGGYAPELPGSPGLDCKTDCFWDNGNGSGNDDCYWDHRCDPLEVAPAFAPEGPTCGYDPSVKLGASLSCGDASASQSATCQSVCLPLVPNGCDCFGCCLVPGAPTPIWMGSVAPGTAASSCFPDALADPDKCKPCTLVKSCENPCEACEVCVGKPAPDAGCGSSPACPAGHAACGSGASCGPNQYCITGCCVDVPA